MTTGTDSTPPSNSELTVEMYISQEELNKTQIPLVWRDYCAHLLPELNKCRLDNYYKPWKCELERIAWTKCQYDDYQRRMRKLANRKELKELELQEAAAEEV